MGTNRYQKTDSKMAGTLGADPGVKSEQTRPKSKYSRGLSAIKNKSTGSLPKSSIRPHEIEIIRVGDEKEMERVLNLNAVDTSSKSSKLFRADRGPIRPLYTQEVIDYKRNAKSAQRQNEIKETKYAFDNVADEGTFDLHRRLEDLIK